MTVQELITAALRKLGVLGAGEVATADDAVTCLEALNGMVDDWSAERLSIYHRTRTVTDITSGTGDYTIGSGGDVDITRPVYLDGVGLVDTTPDPDLERPLRKILESEWEGIPQKSLEADQPGGWYYEPTFPLGVLSLWPVPTGTTLQFALYYPEAVAEFSAVTETLSLPPGYRTALIYNLALRLSSDYKVQLDAALVTEAMKAKARIQRVNQRPMIMSIDKAMLGQACPGSYDINAG